MSHNLKSIYNVCLENEYIPKGITYKEFFTTLNSFHKEISPKIMFGYKFRPNGRLGVFNVVKDIRRGKTINWGDSNKLKAAIIAQGGIPYDKKTAPDGEKWHVYYMDNEYFKWKWFKEGATEFIKNSKYYIFKACTKNRRTVGKVVNENKLVTVNYAVYK
jgi:hypothetical protein